MRKKIVFSAALILILIISIAAVIFVNRDTKDITDVKKVEQLVSQHYILPADEEPALITVTDASKLETEFLSVAKNGDKLLVYQKAKRVIIYRPSIDRIVDIGPVSISGNSDSSQ